MAAFFVHDLKTPPPRSSHAAKLPVHSMTRNFGRIHYGNRQDRVSHQSPYRTTEPSRHELKVELVESDLNEVVTQAIAGLETQPGSVLVKDIHPVPKIALDPDQITRW